MIHGKTIMQTTKTDDRTRRKAEFDELFKQLPGPRNVDKIRQAADAAGVQEITVRKWRMVIPARVPDDRSLKLIRLHISNLAKSA